MDLTQVKIWFARIWQLLKKLSSVLAIIANFSIIFAAVVWLFDLQNNFFSRQKDAWDIISSRTSGESGIGDALEFLNSEFWPYKKKLSLEYINISSPSSKERSIISNGSLESFNANFANAKFSHFNNFMFSDGQFVGVDLSQSVITKTIFNKTLLPDADFQSAIIQNSSFRDSYLSGSKFAKSKILKTKFINVNTSVGTVHRYEKSSDVYGLNFDSSEIFYSELEVTDCNNLSIKNAILSDFRVSGKSKKSGGLPLSGANFLGCKVTMNGSKLLTNFIEGFEVIQCNDCVIMNSDLTFKDGIFFATQSAEGATAIQFTRDEIKNSELVGVLILGNASDSNFENSNFLHVDMSKAVLDGTNVSGTDFNFNFDSTDLSSLRSREWIYKQLYGTEPSNLNPWYEGWIDQELNLETDAKNLRKYFPPEGLSMTWAWSDNPPKNIPDGVQPPIVCDASLRVDARKSGLVPKECLPKDHKSLTYSPSATLRETERSSITD